MSAKQDAYELTREAIKKTNEDPKVQAALKQFQENTKKFAPQATEIEEIQTIQGVFDTAHEEALKLQKQFEPTSE